MSPTEPPVTFSSQVNAICDLLLASGCYFSDCFLVQRIFWNHQNNYDKLVNVSAPSEHALLSTVIRLPSHGFMLTSDADWCGSLSDYELFAKINAHCLGFVPEAGVFHHDFSIAMDNALKLQKGVASESLGSSSGFVCGMLGFIFGHSLFQVSFFVGAKFFICFC